MKSFLFITACFFYTLVSSPLFAQSSQDDANSHIFHNNSASIKNLNINDRAVKEVVSNTNTQKKDKDLQANEGRTMQGYDYGEEFSVSKKGSIRHYFIKRYTHIDTPEKIPPHKMVRNRIFGTNNASEVKYRIALEKKGHTSQGYEYGTNIKLINNTGRIIGHNSNNLDLNSVAISAKRSDLYGSVFKLKQDILKREHRNIAVNKGHGTQGYSNGISEERYGALRVKLYLSPRDLSKMPLDKPNQVAKDVQSAKGHGSQGYDYGLSSIIHKSNRNLKIHSHQIN